MNANQKKKLLVLGAISVFLGVGYLAYVKVKERKEKKKLNESESPIKEVEEDKQEQLN